ncbi:right-handed parallel beta-helix repeat-containing protein [Actinomadura sp. J1-007]|nr:right-handed parallel beta-helix repeat-containing protein [Actinomadura sp. J1-007]MWK34894.1 right-handed parallel beta-helix repeat-containing protein [Actinomadura sp. J1-007]
MGVGLSAVPFAPGPGLGAAAAHADPVADAKRQATLVDQEDQRIMQTRSVLAAILMIGGAATATWKRPQIFGSAQGKTLVLPAVNSGKSYTVADLQRYGGKYFQRQADGSYVLGIHVFLADGAKLLLQNPSGGPFTLRMGSVPGAFSSIVSFGGSIQISGTQRSPAQITSWNPQSRQPDTQVADGRAYIRAVGGDFKMKYAKVSNLGFWSGRTGGIALTGTDRPASAVKHLNKDQRHANKKQRVERNKNGGSGGGGGPGDIETEKPGGTATHVPAADLVTGAIDNSTISGDAFGLFVSGSNQTQVTNNRIENSLVNGLVMHRFAKNANISNTTVTGSAGDGFVLSRATEKVRVTNCTAERNGHNGFTVNGQALAVGPSASGESLESFGDSSINNSVAKDNGHYGIELMGGDKLSVQNSKVIGGDMGIVVRSGATAVQISGNQLTGQVRQGIALRDGVEDASVAGNTISGPHTGVYMRNASGKLVGNVVRGATSHGISLIGSAGGSEVRNNTLSGRGTSAVSSSRAHGEVTKEDNDTDHWTDTASLWMKAQRYMTPLNMIWAAVLLMVAFSMFRARNGGLRIGRTGLHPYALQQPMEKRQVWSLPRRRGGPGQPPPGRPVAGRPMPGGQPAPGRPGQPAPRPMPGQPVAGRGVPGQPVAGRHASPPPPGGPGVPQTVPGGVSGANGHGPGANGGNGNGGNGAQGTGGNGKRVAGPPQPQGAPPVPPVMPQPRGPQPVAPHSSQTTGPRPVPPPQTPPHPTPRHGVPAPGQRKGV